VEKALLISWLFAILVARVASAQAPAAWQDDLVNHLAGVWKLEGAMMGREAHHEVRAEWVLNHQFLRMHEKTAASAPSGEHPYEGKWSTFADFKLTRATKE
jgi:hypothetical protein